MSKRRWILRQRFKRGALVAGEVVYIAQELHVAGLLHDAAPCEHPLLRLAGDLDRHFAHAAERPRIIYEAWHVGRDHAIAHAARADRFAGENAGLNRGFRIIADETANKLHARRDLAAAIL